MSQMKHETSLLAYVIAYLQEELDRYEAKDNQRTLGDPSLECDLDILIADAKEAYAGGAR